MENQTVRRFFDSWDLIVLEGAGDRAGQPGRNSLLPPDNATGNFTTVVQRIPVTIALDDISYAGRFLKERQRGRNLNYLALWAGYKF